MLERCSLGGVRVGSDRGVACNCTGSNGVGSPTKLQSWRSSGGWARMVRTETSIVRSTADAKTNCWRRTTPPVFSGESGAVSDAISN